MSKMSTRILTASVSRDDRRGLETVLAQDGFEVLGVDDAAQAESEISRNGAACILVIDSGLLNMSHDPQWRLLRARQPALGAVVRCLIGSDSGIRRTEERTILVHPDCREGLVEAIRTLEKGASPARRRTTVSNRDGIRTPGSSARQARA